MTVRKAFVGLAIVGLVLAGCAEEVPQVAPPALEPADTAVLTDAQLEAILGGVQATLKVADEEADADLLNSRVSSFIKQQRAANYRIAGDGEGEVNLMEIPQGVAAKIVAGTDTWPRTVMVITDRPQSLESNLLLTLEQEDARSNYQLKSWQRLFPSAEIPVAPDPNQPVMQLDEDTNLLAYPPLEVAEQYVDVLNQGDDSQYAKNFADDEFRKQLADAFAAHTAAFTDSELGSVNKTSAMVPDSLEILGTVDGRAIVTARITTTINIDIGEATLEIAEDQPIAKYLEETELKDSLKISYSDSIAWLVPASGAGEDELIIPIAATNLTLIGAEGDPEEAEEE